MNVIWFAFFTGLTTGGLSCLAVQGGLLATSIASADGRDAGRGSRWWYVTAFLLSKLVAYTILGYALGALGSTLMLSPKMFGALQIFVGLFMLATAARILDLHPIFRYTAIGPPRWAYRLLKRTSRDASWFGPTVLGALTVLLPCGVTQATMAVAVASGSPLMGALIMSAFVLGTSPIFFALGATVVQLLRHRAFAFAASGIVTVFALFSINGGLALRGSLYTVQSLMRIALMDPATLVYAGQVADLTTDGVQEITIDVTDRGYLASATNLKAGIPARLKLITSQTRGCTRAFTIPEYGISTTLPESGIGVVEFTPTKTGLLTYACGMGMFTGQFTVVN